MKYFLALWFLAYTMIVTAQSNTPFHSINVLTYCWNTPSGVDSTVYQAVFSAAGTSRPVSVHFFQVNSTGTPFSVTITGGRLKAGSCQSDSLSLNITQSLVDNDTIINNLNQLLIDNDSLISNLNQILIDNDSLISNLSQLLIDNDTVINVISQILIDNDTTLIFLENINNNFDTTIINLENIVNNSDTTNIYLENINNNSDTNIILLDSIVVLFHAYLDSFVLKLDSLLSLSEEPQICDCLYTNDQENFSLSIPDNSQYVRTNYDYVVYRDCGAGEQEIFRDPKVAVATNTSRAWVRMETNLFADTLRHGEGWIDSIRMYYTNPDTSVFIYFSPEKVASEYAYLLSAPISLDTSHLRYNAGNPAQMIAAIELVWERSVDLFAAQRGLSTPAFDFDFTVDNQGFFKFTTYVTHNPAGHYAGINVDDAGRIIYYHSEYGSAKTTNKTVKTGGTLAPTNSYTTSCGDIYRSHAVTLFNAVDITWKSITVSNPPSTSSGINTNVTCTEPCPQTDGCMSICDTVYVNVTNFPSQEDCQVTGYAGQKSVSSSTYVLDQATYNSVGIAVTTGTVTVSVYNGSESESVTYSAGESVKWTHPDPCKLLSTGFSVNASSGTAKIAFIK